MVVRRHKKVTKYRGSVTHGGGSRKKRRGAGSRGGRGRAGTGKRAGHKKAGMPPQLGQKGFTSQRALRSKPKIINVGDLTLKTIATLGSKGTIDLTAAGYTKLLGAGTIVQPLTIIIPSASARAQEKIHAAGGRVMVSSEQEASPSDTSPASEPTSEDTSDENTHDKNGGKQGNTPPSAVHLQQSATQSKSARKSSSKSPTTQ